MKEPWQREPAARLRGIVHEAIDAPMERIQYKAQAGLCLRGRCRILHVQKLRGAVPADTSAGGLPLTIEGKSASLGL
ncbi:hypothetical protein [Paenibacillus humicus]|uniref:hypothetical protein n=1 Tax=Paenibacillus humicus TaxID=412861 RepID=UPI000FDA9B60|nr:hypothetical protein [Paenibacillus humicus]